MNQPKVYGDFALHESATVARVFLPLNSSVTEGLISSWSRALPEGSPQLTAEMSWYKAFEWGQGHGEFESPWRPSMGSAPEETIWRIMQLLREVAGAGEGWKFAQFPAVSRSLWQPLGRAYITLREFAAMWLDSPLPGSLVFKDTVMLCAPPYADSVIISGPRLLLERGKDLGLEIVVASPYQALPDMQW